MAKEIDVSVSGVVKKVKEVPLGVSGVVKKAKKGVCGVGGAVKTFFEAVTTLYSSTSTTSVNLWSSPVNLGSKIDFSKYSKLTITVYLENPYEYAWIFFDDIDNGYIENTTYFSGTSGTYTLTYDISSVSGSYQKIGMVNGSSRGDYSYTMSGYIKSITVE